MENVRPGTAIHPRSVRAPLVIFDGDCVLCDRTVRFIKQRSAPQTFQFAPRDSGAARAALGAFAGADRIDGILVVVGDRLVVESDAALLVAASLRAPWCALAVLRILPHGLRDGVYRSIARNRYRWFGRSSGPSG